MNQQDIFGDDNFSKWMKFHKANPLVWKLFERYALEAINSGRRHYSARTIMERVRWHAEVTTKGGSFKLNNNHVPYYARLFIQTHPEHADFFETRERKAA